MTVLKKFTQRETLGPTQSRALYHGRCAETVLILTRFLTLLGTAGRDARSRTLWGSSGKKLNGS